MDRIIAFFVRMVVWFSRFVKPLSRLGLYQYDEWRPGKELKVLMVGYNGARNTGADARVVALVRQLLQRIGHEGLTIGDEQVSVSLTVMTLDEGKVSGYFPSEVHLLRFTTLFFFSLLRAASRSHVAVLCEGSTLTRTFADALCVFYCEAAGIMRRQHKPCISYGSEVGHLDGWLARLSSDLCRDTYFIARTEESLRNLKALRLEGHVGTDTAWTIQTDDGEEWAQQQLRHDGWDGHKPLIGVAVLNPFCWPVCPSLWRWLKASLTGNHSQQYDKMYFFSDSAERQQLFSHYIQQIAAAVNRYQRERDAFVVILGMEQLDTEPCRQLSELIDGPHALYTSKTCDVFQMTGVLRQLQVLVTSRYHAAVLSMERAIPIVAISMDARLGGVISETELSDDFLFTADDRQLDEHITHALHLADSRRQQIAETISRHLADYKAKTDDMCTFFTSWLNIIFS